MPLSKPGFDVICRSRLAVAAVVTVERVLYCRFLLATHQVPSLLCSSDMLWQLPSVCSDRSLLLRQNLY